MPTTDNYDEAKEAQRSSNRHEEGSVRDGTAAHESKANREGWSAEDAMDEGRKTAQENLKKEEADSTISKDTLPDVLDDARATAEANQKAEEKAASDTEATGDVLKNDTSSKAKFETAKSQLNPKNNKTPTDAQIKETAHADTTTGNDTGISPKENAERAYAEPSQPTAPEVTAPEGETADVKYAKSKSSSKKADKS